MATRDLTKNFIERRTAALKRRQRSDVVSHTSRLGGGSSDYQKLTANGIDELLLEEGGIQMSSMNGGNSSTTNGVTQQGALNSHSHVQRPAWCNDVDTIHSVLSDIQRQMDALQSLHSTRVGSVFGKDLDDMEGKIERLTNELTNQFRYAEKLLQRIGTATKDTGGHEAMVGANVQRSLAKTLQELSVTFRQSQRKYLTEVQNQKSSNLVDGDSRFGIDLTNDSTSNGGSDGNFFTTQQMTVVDDLTQAVQSRDQEIIQIAKSIEELGAIFKELAVLVIDQGTVLDRIDYNMEAVVEHTKTGVQQLERANNAQKSARPLKCIVCLSSLVFVLLMILILKHHRFHIFF